MYHGFTIDLLVELVRSGLATAQAERVVAGGRAMEIARVRITDAGAAGAGERLLTAGPPMTQFILSTIGGAGRRSSCLGGLKLCRRPGPKVL